MAQYEHLTIYKKVFDVSVYIENNEKNGTTDFADYTDFFIVKSVELWIRCDKRLVIFKFTPLDRRIINFRGDNDT